MFLLLFLSTSVFSYFVYCDISCGQNNVDGKGFQNTPQWSGISRVIGGRDAKPGEVPWVADLRINLDGRSKALCGGAVIDKYTILTAAHCMFACPRSLVPPFMAQVVCPNYKVRSFRVCLGLLNKRNPKEQQCYETSTFNVHPDYKCCSYSMGNDIAIIKITEGIDMPKFTKDGYGSTNSICLPPATDAGKEYSGQAIIAGWGRTNSSTNEVATVLQIGTVNFISTKKCQENFGSDNVDSSQVCVYSDDTSSCNGDSGSALYIEDQTGTATAVGITSFGKVNCRKNPVVYTKVAAFRDFIDQNSGPPKYQ